MKIGIFGSGFGLYGYLPAFTQLGFQDILLPSRYKAAVVARKELANQAKHVSFLSDDGLIQRNADHIVICKNPEIQTKCIKSGLEPNKTFFLEKPLGTTLTSYESNLAKLEGLNFNVAYLFKYLPWANDFKSGNLTIDWEIKKQQYGWKSEENLSGGLMLYYGIHIYALLVDLRVEDKFDIYFDDNINQSLIYKSSNASIKLRWGLEDQFLVFGEDSHRRSIEIKQENPFGGKNLKGEADNRIPFLAQYISQTLEKQKDSFPLEREYKIMELLKRTGRTL